MGRNYGVKLVRGPFVRLPPHPQACHSEDELRTWLRSDSTVGLKAVDLFCGAGGLSLGLQQAGFSVVLGVDDDDEALETHRALCPGLSVNWDLGQEATVDRIASLIRELDISVLAGGPPCQPFSKAGRSMLRHLVADGRRAPHDERRDLWLAFLEVAKRARPTAILMENVPDMVLDRDMLVLRTMVDELERAGYAVQERLVETFRFGVPQFRQRLILVALADGIDFEWPQESPDRVSVRHAIGDLPPVEGGWRPAGGETGWINYPGQPTSSFQREMRQDLEPEGHGRLYDHITRPVRDDDAEAFALMDSSTRYSDLPEELRRYRDDIFDDKYKRLSWNEFSRTITAHIAKDGYWYIHPEQDRTLTIREAARLQTFPDHVRFAGPPSAAFRQIGNAVPPRLARAVGEALRASLQAAREAPSNTRTISGELAAWMATRTTSGEVIAPWNALAVPDLLAGGQPDPSLRWLALLAQTLCDRVPYAEVCRMWPAINQQLGTPTQTCDNEKALALIARALKRESRVEQILVMARGLCEAPHALESLEALEKIEGVSRAAAHLAVRLVPDADHDPIEAGNAVLRVAARHWGQPVDVGNKRSDGRVAVARLVGVDDEASKDPIERSQAALAHLALFEIAADVCTPTDPACGKCPLEQRCASAGWLSDPQQLTG